MAWLMPAAEGPSALQQWPSYQVMHHMCEPGATVVLFYAVYTVRLFLPSPEQNAYVCAVCPLWPSHLDILFVHIVDGCVLQLLPCLRRPQDWQAREATRPLQAEAWRLSASVAQPSGQGG